jgi:hypothetical protein
VVQELFMKLSFASLPQVLFIAAITSLLIGATAPPMFGALPNLPDTSWMTNGNVRAIVQYGNIIWLGGEFSELRERAPGQGGQVISVNNLAALDVITGAPVPGLNMPAVEGSATVAPIIYALALAGEKLYIGGSFSKVGGEAHRDLAAIDAATGAVDTKFNPNIGVVWTLAADATRVYAGGGFTQANGQPRKNLAAFAFDGTLDPIWTPSADDRPRDMAFAPDGKSIFIVGHFKNVAGPDGVFVPRDSVVRLDTDSGNVLPWTAGCPCSTELFGLGVEFQGDRVYIGMGGSDWVASYDLNTGGQFWRTDVYGQVQHVAVMGDQLIIAGHYTHVAATPGFNCGSQGAGCVPRQKLAALSLAGFLDLDWDPSMTGDFDGVWRVLANGPQLYGVGEFLKVHGVSQQKVARFTHPNSSPAVSVTPVSWNFANQSVGTTSAPRMLTLYNTGTATLNITSIETDPADYAQNNTCIGAVAPGTSCKINVTFTPSTTGIRTGTLSITDDANNSPQILWLSGNGTGTSGVRFVRAAGNSASATANVISMATTAGNYVVVAVAFPSTSPRVVSVTDSGGSTYTLLTAANNGVSARIELWQAHSIQASTSITVSLSGVVKSRVEAAEYSGVRSVGVPATIAGWGTLESITLNTVDKNASVVAGFAEKNSTAFLPRTGNLRGSGSLTVGDVTVGAALNDNAAVSGSSVTNAVTTNTSGPWAAAAVELAP